MNPFETARANASDVGRANIDLIERFFDLLEKMDFEAASQLFHDDARYRDEPSHEADAVGPAAIAGKLTNAISGLKAFPMCVDKVVGDGERVMSRRAEEWHFPTGEVLKLPVMCVHEIRDGKIADWHEFWNMQSFTEQLPPSWMEEIIKRAQAAD